MEALQPGDPGSVGGYQLLGRLGAGGMGQVYLGVSPGGRKVAVKLIHPVHARDAQFRERFAREIQAARRVGGFHTALVVDADPNAEPPWMVTAYMEGPSLQEGVGRYGPLPPDQVRALGAGLAEGLAAIHACGLVHRDLKPGNVIMAADGPRIIDFGIARVIDASTGITAAGAVIGTIAFMSPEQIRGDPAGTASDVFSLGSVLGFAATGRPPFGSDSAVPIMFRLVNQPPDLAGATGERLREVITACLAKDPGDRPPVRAVLAALSHPGLAPSALSSPAAFSRPASAPAATGPGRGTLPPRGTDPSAWPAPPRTAPPMTGPSRAGHARRSHRRAPWLAATAAVVVAAAVILAVRLIPGSTPPAAAGHRTGPAASAGSSATTRDHGRRTGGAGAGSTNAVRDLTLQDLGNVGLNEVSFTTDGKLLTDTSPGGHVYVWDVATGKLVHTVNTSSEVSVDPAVSPDGTLAASSVSATSGGVYLWDVATGKPITTLSNPKLPVGIDALLFSPDGKFLAVGDGGHIYIWNVAARTVTASIATPGTLINTLAFSPNSMLLATSTVTGTTTVNPVQLWAVATGDQISTPLAGNPDVEQGGVQGLAFSPDGKILAASGRGGIYLWGVTTSSLTGTLNRPGEGILPLDYSPDGTLLAVGDWASATRAFVLNAATGTVLHTFTDPGEYPVSDVTFSPDGKLLAFADRVGEIYVKVTSQLVGG